MKVTAVYIDDEVDTEKEEIKIAWLRQRDVDVVPVKYVGDALRELRKRRVDIVLLDVLMAPYDVYALEETKNGTDTGLRLLQDIRREFPNLPVIVISVKKPVDVESALESLRADGYLYKPVLGVDILEEIIRVIGDWREKL